MYISTSILVQAYYHKHISIHIDRKGNGEEMPTSNCKPLHYPQYSPQYNNTIRTMYTQQIITEDLYERFIAYLDASPTTVDSYSKTLRPLFKFFSSNGIKQPRREDILAFRDQLKENHKPTTVQSYIAVTRLFFRWLEQEGIYPNIAEHIKGAKLDKEHKKDCLTSKQVKAVLNSVDRSTTQGLRDYAILALMITGGLRTIEVSRINIDDIRPLGDAPVIFIQGKGREEKTEYTKLQAPVEEAIREYVKSRSLVLRTDPLFVSTSNNSRGKRLSTRSISGIVKTRLREAGFDSDRLTAHSLRHTAITLSLLAGKDLTEVQQFARHADISATQIYNHALDKAKNSCSEAISDEIFGSM